MQCLQRIDEHAGDVAAAADYGEAAFVHVAQGICVVRGERIAGARLYVVPPAMVGTAEAHEMAAARVIAREANGLHHRFGARHVKRDFIEPRDAFQGGGIVGDAGVVAAEYRAQLGDPLGPFADAGLVEVGAEQIGAVGTAEVEEFEAVEVAQHDTATVFDETAGRQVFV